MTLSSSNFPEVAAPGQFVMLQTSDGMDTLLRRAKGEGVGLMGPLGKGFEVPGGLGVAPFRFLFSVLRERGVETTLFYGAKKAQEMVPLEDLKRSDLSLVEATEDGSRGEEGRIAGVFRKEIEKANVDRSCRVYVCGLGTCMGCVTPTQNGYQRVCRESPVFSAGDVFWDTMK